MRKHYLALPPIMCRFCRRWDPQTDICFKVAAEALRIFQDFCPEKNVKKSEKKHKIHARAIDESSGKIYIHFHRRNTAALLFDRSGKEITD